MLLKHPSTAPKDKRDGCSRAAGYYSVVDEVRYCTRFVQAEEKKRRGKKKKKKKRIKITQHF